MNHVMIDLETLDTRPTTKILSLGAVKFDPETGEVGDTLYAKFDPGLQVTRTESKATLSWWGKQDAVVRIEAFSGLNALDSFLQGSLRDFLFPKPIVWGNGSTFDISILEHAYSYNTPWRFWNVRDVRTIVELAHGVIGKEQFTLKGQAHNALDDAIHQARYVSAMYIAIRTGLGK